MSRAVARGHLATWFALCASLGVACGVTDVKVKEQSSAGSSSEAGTEHTGGSGGEGTASSGGRSLGGTTANEEAGGPSTASGGTAPVEPPGSAGSGGEGNAPPVIPSCDPACSGDTPVCIDQVCVACTTGSKKCEGNTPVACEDGAWVAGDACTSSTPACSNGVCAAVRLQGGVVSVTPIAGSAEIRLRNATFSQLPRSCGKVGGKDLCVKGSIR